LRLAELGGNGDSKLKELTEAKEQLREAQDDKYDLETSLKGLEEQIEPLKLNLQ
jgi:predicted  nucleic acid-binding Zn-ribbon protein